MPRKKAIPLYGTTLGDPLHQPRPHLDRTKMMELLQHAKAAWRTFEGYVNELPVPQGMKETLKHHAAQVIHLREEYWDLLAGACLDQTAWLHAQTAPLRQQLEKHREGPRQRHKRATERNAIINQKLAEGWNPQTIFQFLSQQRPDLIKGVSSAGNMMKTFHRSNPMRLE
jgi:hypothetical protein